MEGETEQSDKEGSFSKASIPKRLAIVVAGASVNIIFGILVYFTMTSISGVYVSNTVDSTVEGYAANSFGIQPGDRIVSLDNQEINSKTDIDEILENSTGENIKIAYERNENYQEGWITPTEQNFKSTGIYLKDSGKVITVEKGSSAEKQGIKANDVILKINGKDTNNDVNTILELIQDKNSSTLLLTIQREGKVQNIELTPDYISKYYLGIVFKPAEDTIWNHLVNGGIQTKEFAFSIIDSLKQLFTGGVSMDQMMGPVGISETVAKTNGIQEFIYLLALISLSLGITNLLPIPALDGGKIIILLIEAIRRKPLKPETEINIQLLGFSLLIALTIYITYQDLLRIG